MKRPLEIPVLAASTLLASTLAAACDVDASGRLHVLDTDAFRVVYDSTLSVERTLGGEGEGPGELAGPLGIDVGPEGQVAVFDYRKSGRVRWGPDGEPMAMERPAVPFTSSFERTAHGFLTLVTERGSGPTIHRLAYLRDGDTTTVASRAVESSGQIQLESCGVRFPRIGRVLEPGINWTHADGEDLLAVASGVPYRVDIYRDTGLVRSLRRSVEPREVTEEMARSQLADGMQISVGGAPRTCEAEEVLEKRGVAPTLQTVNALRFAPSGELWVVRGHVQGEEPAIDVFDPEGTYLGTLPPGTPVPVAFLPDGRLVAEETDDLEVDRLVVYRVERSGED